MDYKQASRDFIKNEEQFQLGVIITEQANELTKNLSFDFQNDTTQGVKTIFSADGKIAPVALEAYKSKNFKALVKDIKRCMDTNQRVVISSVGASGRLAIQLDGAWRKFFNDLAFKLPIKATVLTKMANCVEAFTTGGDRALIRSVENYEDYMTFGARQVRDAHMTKDDVLLGLSECGLSASINGSVCEAHDIGCRTYYLHVNPKDVLYKKLERCRQVFDRPNVLQIPLFVGNMAVTGSTRMQATTIQLIVAGAALEHAISLWCYENLSEAELKVAGPLSLSLNNYAKEFVKLNKAVSSGKAVEGIAKFIELETAVYEKKGLITYVTHEYLLDVLTDTTERQPTFTVPPFRKFLDQESEISWAYIKDPLYPSDVAWQHVFRRPIKGLDWTKEDYIQMKAHQFIIDKPPLVATEEVLKYNIGNEDDPSRYSKKPNCLVLLDINGSACTKAINWFKKELHKYERGVVVRIGNIPRGKIHFDEIHIPVKVLKSSNEVMSHLMVKVIFNCVSTGTMAKMGRIWGNWMIQVLPTNKKLIDRSTRIIQNIAGISYEQANEEFFKSYYGRDPKEEYRESYVVESLRRLGFDPKQKRQ